LEHTGADVKPKKAVLTEQELEIMKIVWRRGKATVRDVYEELLSQRKIAYTTVMTMMGILEQKGHLKKSADDRAYVYTPAQPQREVVGSMVHDFVTRVFNGSAKPLLVHLIEEKKISPEELDEISQLLKDKRRKK
jgi:predicted transcriptional regulator